MSEATDLVELLRRIGIRASREALEAWLTHATKTKASPAQATEQLCTLEQREREARNLASRVKMATLGSYKPLDRFDWNHPRTIDRALYEQLHTSLDFVRRGENVLLRGQAGVGKTTLAQNLGLHALERGLTVRFSTLPAALADLLKQESIPATERRLRRYTFPDLLILDELGYVPCDSRAADLLFHIISRRQPRLQAVGLRLPRRLVPRRTRRPLRSALPRPRHRRRVLAKQEGLAQA
jgi:DNA replication protein DnaC